MPRWGADRQDEQVTAFDDRPVQPVLTVPRNPFAVPSLVLGIVAEALGAAFSLGSTAVIASRTLQTTVTTAQLLGVLSLVENIVAGLVGLSALVVGLIALFPRTRPRRAVAAAGTAIGAVIVFGVLVSLLSTLLLASIAR